VTGVAAQTANRRSPKLATRLGFHHVDTFEEFGAKPALAAAHLHTFRDLAWTRPPCGGLL
jgi:hypothetical protein